MAAKLEVSLLEICGLDVSPSLQPHARIKRQDQVTEHQGSRLIAWHSFFKVRLFTNPHGEGNNNSELEDKGCNEELLFLKLQYHCS